MVPPRLAAAVNWAGLSNFLKCKLEEVFDLPLQRAKREAEILHEIEQEQERVATERAHRIVTSVMRGNLSFDTQEQIDAKREAVRKLNL